MLIGKNIKELRIKNNLTQFELGNKLFVSDKTISSWESGRTYPDITMLIELCNVLKTNILFLISGSNSNDTELEIKLKVDKIESERILNLIKKDSVFLKEEIQNATYYKPFHRNMNNEWLRIRKENKNVILNYKKKENEIIKEYEVNIDNENNLKTIFNNLDFSEVVKVNKKRISYLYNDKYEISFDDVENLGLYIEFELKKYEKEYVDEYQDLIEFLYNLNVNINNIETKRYPDLMADNTAYKK